MKKTNLVSPGKAKRADCIIYFKPNIPIVLIEAKDNDFSAGDGIQQALEYAVTLKSPLMLASNGDDFVAPVRAPSRTQVLLSMLFSSLVSL